MILYKHKDKGKESSSPKVQKSSSPNPPSNSPHVQQVQKNLDIDLTSGTNCVIVPFMSSHHETLEEMYARHNRERQVRWDKYQQDMNKIHEDHQRNLRTAMMVYAVLAIVGLVLALVG